MVSDILVLFSCIWVIKGGVVPDIPPTEVKKNVDINCKKSSSNSKKELIYWHGQKQTRALEHVIFLRLRKIPA